MESKTNKFFFIDFYSDSKKQISQFCNCCKCIGFRIIKLELIIVSTLLKIFFLKMKKNVSSAQNESNSNESLQSQCPQDMNSDPTISKAINSLFTGIASQNLDAILENELQAQLKNTSTKQATTKMDDNEEHTDEELEETIIFKRNNVIHSFIDQEEGGDGEAINLNTKNKSTADDSFKNDIIIGSDSLIKRRRGRPPKIRSLDDNSSIKILSNQPTNAPASLVKLKKKNKKEESDEEYVFNDKSNKKKRDINIATRKLQATKTKEKNLLKKKSLTKMEFHEPKMTIIKLSIPKKNLSQLFAQIKDLISKDGEIFYFLHNLALQAMKIIEEKKLIFKKKWNSLRRANIKEDEFKSREAALQNLEKKEFSEIKTDLLEKFKAARLPSFETREDIIEESKKIYEEENKVKFMELQGVQFEINEDEIDQFMQLQRDLVDKILIEKLSFYSPKGYDEKHFEQKVIKNPLLNAILSEQLHKTEKLEQKMQDEPLLKDVEEKKEAKKIKIKLSKLIDEDAFSSRGTDNKSSITQDMTEIMDYKDYKKIKLTKNERTYFDEKINRLQYQKYSKFLKDFSRDKLSISQLSESNMVNLIDATSFILNSVHYYQKFKKEKDFLHPFDIMYLLSKTY